VRRLIVAVTIGLLVAGPAAFLTGAVGVASADPAPSPTPSVSDGSAIGVTIGGAPTSGGGNLALTGNRGGGGAATSPAGSLTPKKPAIPDSPTATKNRLKLNRTTFHAGQTLLATGTGFAPGEKVQFVLYPGAKPVKSFTADRTGSVIATFVLPSRFPTGVHTIEGTGWQSGAVASTDFFVVSVAGVLGSAGQPWIVWAVGGTAGVLVVGLVCAALLGWFPRRPPRLLAGGQRS
jgi:hypothetical protein